MNMNWRLQHWWTKKIQCDWLGVSIQLTRINCMQSSTIPELTRCRPPKEDRGPYINSISGAKLKFCHEKLELTETTKDSNQQTLRQDTCCADLQTEVQEKQMSTIDLFKTTHNQSIHHSINCQITQLNQPNQAAGWDRWPCQTPMNQLPSEAPRQRLQHTSASSRPERDALHKTTSDWIDCWSCSGKGKCFWIWVKHRLLDWSYFVERL